MNRIVFADVETTHLDPQVGHIWELALIVRDPGGEDVEYLWRIRPDLANADPNALRVGRYYERNVEPAPRPGSVYAVEHPEIRGYSSAESTKVAAEVAELLDGAVLVGQNAQFDAAHLAAFLRRNGQAYTAHYRPICVTTMAAGFLHGIKAEADATADADRVARLDALHPAVEALPWSSRDIAKAVGVDVDGYETHTALGDARLAMNLWDCMLQGGAS